MLRISNGNFVVIEGNIGTGKTSLVRLLAGGSGERVRTVFEEFSDNPFLPLFYANPERYAFPVELFFMTERHKQWQEVLNERSEGGAEELLLSDYLFDKTFLFAGQNLKGDELELFGRLFERFRADLPAPDLLLYLHRPVEELLVQIRSRNRPYEQDIRAEYLERIQGAYFEFFERQAARLPIVVLDASGLDFVHRTSDMERILEVLSRRYAPGLHRI